MATYCDECGETTEQVYCPGCAEPADPFDPRHHVDRVAAREVYGAQAYRAGWEAALKIVDEHLGRFGVDTTETVGHRVARLLREGPNPTDQRIAIERMEDPS